MLYMNPPYYIFDGVSVFSDHADPLQFYYLPMMPKLTLLTDPKTKKRIPQIQVIKFRGRAGGGGILNFDCNIGVEQDVLDDIRAEVKRLNRLSQTPRLAPVPLVDGTVKMMLFGTQTGETPTEETPDKQFVLKIDQAASPALYGNNQAAFSVRLDQDGVVMLDKALMGEMSPIGIVYSLSYLALRPAYNVKLVIDWDRVQKHMNENFKSSVFFSSTEIDKTVDELIDKRFIDLQVDTFVPEGDDSAGIISRRDQAVNEVREMMTDSFFEPSLKPIDRSKSTADQVMNVAERVSTMAVTGGWASVASFSYKKTDYKRIDRKVLNVNMSERTTVKRTIAPQGHLSGLFRIMEDEKLDINRFIISVDLDDPWFARRKVAVISRAAFEEDSVGSLNVSLRYNNEPKNVILDPANPRAELDWGSVVASGGMKREVEVSYKVNFKGVDSAERPISLTSPKQTVDVDNIEIDPRELYGIEAVPLVALGFPWKQYPNVEVQLRYADPANGINQIDNFILSERKQEETWRMFVRDPTRLRFQYKLTFRAANHKDVVMPWVESEDLQVFVRDPFPRKRSLMVVPSFPWDEVERAFVDVSYEDKGNKISESQSFEFTEEEKGTKAFAVDLANPDLRTVAYKVTVMFKDGRLLEVPESYTRADRVIVRSDMKGHRIIQVRPAPVEFLKKKLKELVVEAKYEDADAGLSDSEIFNFKVMTEKGEFEYDYVDESKPGYQWRATYRYTNGLTKSTPWQKASATELIVPVV